MKVGVTVMVEVFNLDRAEQSAIPVDFNVKAHRDCQTCTARLATANQPP